jgi:hypothetical protein
MGKGIVVFILDKFLSALLRLESKLIVAACRDASVIRGIFSKFVTFFRVRTLRHTGVPTCRTISLDSSLKRAEKN